MMFYMLAAFVVGVVGIHVVQYRKDYLGTWNGHQIQIVYKYLSFDILVDNEVVIANAKHSCCDGSKCKPVKWRGVLQLAQYTCQKE